MPTLSLGGILRNSKGGEWRVVRLQATRDASRFTHIELLALEDERADQWHHTLQLTAVQFSEFCEREGIQPHVAPE